MPFRASDYPHPYAVFPNTKFISICVPTFCRPFYLKKLLDTLEQYADMPYEVIVGDDGSPDKKFRDEVYAMSDRISVTLFNNGLNAGLCTAANRVISQASSKYVLFMNDDCFFERPCLRDICNVLSHDYVGVVSPCNDIGPMPDSDVCNTNGTRWSVSNFLGGGSAMGFRKDVWQEVGGWDERSTSGQSDNVFFFKIMRAGYWKAVVEGPERVKVGNFVYGNDYKATAQYMRYDCSLPKLFGVSEADQIMIAHKRREACQVWVDGERTIPNRETFDERPNPVWGHNDIPAWSNHFLDLFGGNHSHCAFKINWELAKVHGQGKWEQQIRKDFRL